MIDCKDALDACRTAYVMWDVYTNVHYDDITLFIQTLQMRYDTIKYVNMRSKAEEMASLI